MQTSVFDVASVHGRPARCTRYRQGPVPRPLAVVLPGANYSCDAPLLWYARLEALHAGFDVLTVEYGFQANRATPGPDEVATVAAELEPVLAPTEPALFISKSLGTAVVATLAQTRTRAAQHIFLTPLRQAIDCMRAARRALAVTGDRDPLFSAGDRSAIAGLPRLQLRVAPGADHLLENQGDPLRSLQTLTEVAGWCREFLAGAP